MMLCSNVSPGTSTESLVEPLLGLTKSDATVITKSQHDIRATLIFKCLRILALDGRQKARHHKETKRETPRKSR